VAAGIDDLERAIAHWRTLDGPTGEARLYPLAQFMIDVYAGALLLEQAGFEQRELGTDRKQLVARLYARAHLAGHGPLRGVDAPPEELQRFKDLYAGAFVGAS
jgi:acyl-CoA dehydrogenase